MKRTVRPFLVSVGIITAAFTPFDFWIWLWKVVAQ